MNDQQERTVLEKSRVERGENMPCAVSQCAQLGGNLLRLPFEPGETADNCDSGLWT